MESNETLLFLCCLIIVKRSFERKSNMKTKTISLFLAILMLLSVLSSCSKENEETDVPNEEYEDAFNYNTFAGVVVSAGDTKIDKNDNFEIAEIKVSVGDTIKEGDVLFVYDTQKATLDLERAKLELEQLENNLKNLRDTKERLEKEKTAAPADQQLQYSLEIQETETDILEGEYNIKSKTKDIENLTSNLEKKEITSPISGTVTAINKDGSQDYGQTQAFMTISETGTVRVQGYVNESNVTISMSVLPLQLNQELTTPYGMELFR